MFHVVSLPVAINATSNAIGGTAKTMRIRCPGVPPHTAGPFGARWSDALHRLPGCVRLGTLRSWTCRRGSRKRITAIVRAYSIEEISVFGPSVRNDIIDFTATVNYEQFQRDKMRRYATERRLETPGEAAFRGSLQRLPAVTPNW